MVHFVVTGFSTFLGVSDNPTERLVEMLEQRGAESPDLILSTAVLEVAAQPAKEWLAQVYASPELAAAAAEGPVVLLHLGVDVSGCGFKLERQAVNEATFCCPDQRGWRPQGQLIDDRPGCTLSTHLQTDLDVGQLAAQLAGRQRHNAAVSLDAGRFVCNYTYYLSLLHSEAARQRCGAPLHSLFVHVPPATVISLEQQFAFLLDVLEAVAAALAPAVQAAAGGTEAAAQVAPRAAVARADALAEGVAVAAGAPA
ncbi:hypothetical protein ABPG75_009128 [Micractinium tetrahymenae]